MCHRSKARALRAQQMSHVNGAFLTSVAPLSNNKGGSAIDALAGAVNNLALKSQSAQPHISNQVPVHPKIYNEEYPSDAPPAYEKISGQVAPEVVTREMTNSTYNTTQPQPYVSQPVELPSQFQTSSPQISRLIEGLTAALAAYQSGAGRLRGVRRAQKALRDELYEEEVARRMAMHGRLRCGERKQIWREVKAINFGH